MRGRRRERKHPEASDQNRGTRTVSLEREEEAVWTWRERGSNRGRYRDERESKRSHTILLLSVRMIS